MAAVLVSACATPPPSRFEPEDLHRVQAYAGAAKPPGEIATLFTMDGRPRSESATMCEIDGVSLEQGGVCASVAYVLPGTHVVRLRYSSSHQFGGGMATVVAAAGHLYQINFSSLNVNYSALVSVIVMYDGARLTWRNLAPGLAAGSPRVDEAVPAVANVVIATPAQEGPLSLDERAIAQRVVECAATFATDVDVRKADHREYQSGFAKVGAWVRTAQDYLSETGATAAFEAARAESARDYRVALDPARAGSPESTAAHDRLAAAMQDCEAFGEQHSVDFATRQALVRAR